MSSKKARRELIAGTGIGGSIEYTLHGRGSCRISHNRRYDWRDS